MKRVGTLLPRAFIAALFALALNTSAASADPGDTLQPEDPGTSQTQQQQPEDPGTPPALQPQDPGVGE